MSSGNKTKVSTEYQERLNACEFALAQHIFQREVIQHARKWNRFSLFFDCSLIGLGSYCFYETCRRADEEASLAVAMSGNPFLRRAFTPFPIFASLVVIVGLLWVPADLIALSTARDLIALQDNAIKRLETLKASIDSGVGAPEQDE